MWYINTCSTRFEFLTNSLTVVGGFVLARERRMPSFVGARKVMDMELMPPHCESSTPDHKQHWWAADTMQRDTKDRKLF